MESTSFVLAEMPDCKEILSALQKFLCSRACDGIDLSNSILIKYENDRRYGSIPLHVKTDLFHRYCNEKSQTGQLLVKPIETKLEAFADGRFNIFALLTAEVLISEVCISSTCRIAVHSFESSSSPASYLQDVSNEVLDEALSNAGFGPFGWFPIPMGSAALPPVSSAGESPIPSIPDGDGDKTEVVSTQKGRKRRKASSEITSSSLPSVSSPIASNSHVDIESLRRVICPIGLDKGSTLGSLLDQGKLASLEYLAEKWGENGHPAKIAAKELLNSRCKEEC